MLRVSILTACCLALAVAQHGKVKSPEKLSESVPVVPDTPILLPEQAENLFFVVSAKNLAATDTNGGLVDPYVKVAYGAVPPNVKKQGSDLDLVDVSETINDNANPTWIKVFKILFRKGTYQKLYLEVGDHDPINPDDIVGDAYIDLDEYVAKGQEITVPLSSKAGSVTVKKTTPFLFTLSLKNVPALDEFGGLSDPFVKCYFRTGEEGVDMKFYETETVNNVDSASWDTPIAFDNYQRGTKQIFHFKVRDHDTITGNDDIGDAFLDIDAFVDKKMSSVLPLSKTHNSTLIVKYHV